MSSFLKIIKVYQKQKAFENYKHFLGHKHKNKLTLYRKKHILLEILCCIDTARSVNYRKNQHLYF
jgi:hypothetical protein